MADDGALLAVFDLCDTLYDANTTVGFIRHYAKTTQNPRVTRALKRWLDRGSPFFYLGAALHRFAGYDLARKRLIGSLAGESRDRLAEAARDYARSSLPPLANAAVHERLEAHRAAGDRIVLVSSSLDLVVDAVAFLLKAEYRASTLDFAGGVCTGQLVRDLTGNKASVVRELIDDRHDRLMVYTDNRSDRELVDMADDATIIIPKGADSGQWAGAKVEYLRL